MGQKEAHDAFLIFWQHLLNQLQDPKAHDAGSMTSQEARTKAYALAQVADDIVVRQSQGNPPPEYLNTKVRNLRAESIRLVKLARDLDVKELRAMAMRLLDLARKMEADEP